MCGGTFWLRGNFLWTVEGRLGWGGGGWGEEVYLCGWDGLTFMGGWKWVG